MKNIYVVFLAALFVSQISFAQQTGSFTKTVSFGGNPNWPIAFYVPSNYNAANKYKLIVALHGLGGTCGGYRDYFTANVVSSPSSPVYNAIVVAPGNGDGSSSDFWTAPCDTSIISIAMNLATSTYNIDANSIYLNGISLGGHAALRYGLINYWRFRGMDLWCPAVQSVAEANNQTGFNYPYQNGKYMPISISVGSEDGYIQNGQLDATMKQLIAVNGHANLQIEIGVPHGAPGIANIYNNYKYVDANASTYTQNDAGISDIITPFDEECSTGFTPIVVIQNKGINNLTSATVNYQLDAGTVNTYSWTGNLKRLETANITLPAQAVGLGSHVFNVYTTLPNGSADATPVNDALVRNFKSLTNGSNSLTEGFENAVYPPTGWKQTGSDKVWIWKKISGIGAGGSSSCIRFDNWTFDKSGKKYAIHTAEYDFTNANGPTLTYDYAYAPLNDGSGDTLTLYYSTDCGNTWTFLMKKAGLALSTTGGSTSTWFIPTSSQWKKETINLSSLIGKPKVMFSFSDSPNYSNLLYLDNINLTGVTGITEQTEQHSLVVYPNPVSSAATVLSEMKNCTLKLIDITGNTVRSFLNVDQFPFVLEKGNLSPGIYVLELSSENKIERTKFVVE